MTSIICKAYFFDNRTISLATTISPSFQAAVTPWILSLAVEKYDNSCSVAEIKYYARSPTFQFTRSLRICFRDVNDCRDFMKSDLCAPLFSHLRDLTFYDDSRADKNWFDHGNTLADFVLKFQRLQNLETFFHPQFTSPSELITFYLRLFHSKSISQTLLVSVIKSYAENMIQCRTSREKSSECDSLIKQHKIIPYLVQKMVEMYRGDHGESLVVFFQAILCSFMRSSTASAWTESDSIDELVPMLDLIETIVMNGDLLHPCFYNQEITSDPEDQKWALSKKFPEILKACLHSANYSRLDLMQRYGRTLLPQLADFIVSKYDGSKYALRAFTHSIDLFFRVMDDYFWTDQVESRRDEAGLKKMLEGGRKLLQHIPFGKLEFMIQEAIGIPSVSSYILLYSNYFLYSIMHYCTTVASLSSQLRDAVSSDVASQQLVKHHLLPLFFDLAVSTFDQQLQDKGMSSAVFFANIREFLHPAGANNNRRIFAIISQDFFSRDERLDKLLDFSQNVCDRFEEEFRNFRHVVRTSCNVRLALKGEELNAEDTSKLKQQRAMLSKLKLVLDELASVVNCPNAERVANCEWSESKSDENGDDYESRMVKRIQAASEGKGYFARIEDFVVRQHGLRQSYEFYLQLNSEKLKLLKLDED